MDLHVPTISFVCTLALLLVVQGRVQGLRIGGNITTNTNLALEGSPYVVSKDIAVAENATLTIQPGVHLLFDPGIALHVKGSLQAKGNSHQQIVFRKIPTNRSEDDVNITSPYYDGIRLNGSKNFRTGRLEIFLNGQWGTVCGDNWDMKDTQVACRQLGFLVAKRFYRHGRGTGPIWLRRVDCQGHETTLVECRHWGIGTTFCSHWQDVGIECHSHDTVLANQIYWKGVHFSTSIKPPSLQYVQIEDAYKAIKGDEFLPNLYHVAIKRSVYGVISEKLNTQLTICESSFMDNLIAGIRIKSELVPTTIENTRVVNTTYGDGLSYSGTLRDPVEFCSVDTNNITFPITLQASGKSNIKTDCAKIIRTRPGLHLKVYYQLMTGEMFELEAHDGNTVDARNLSFVNQWTFINEVNKSFSSSGHEIYLRFRYNGRYGARVKLVITDKREFSSLKLSNCTFSDNYGSGGVLSNMVGNIAILTTDAFRNGGDGILAQRILGAKGDEQDVSSLELVTCAFSENQGRGVTLKDLTGKVNISTVTVDRNKADGIIAERIMGTVTITQTHFINNKGDGFEIAEGNGNIEFQYITAALNKGSGVLIHDGKASSSFLFCNFSRNMEDGCSISNQVGSHRFINCTSNSNFRHGINLFDLKSYYNVLPRHRFNRFSLLNSAIKYNSKYGLKLCPECQYWRESAVNVTLTIINNQIVSNFKGGIILSPDLSGCLVLKRPREVSAVVKRNHFEDNKVNTLRVYCTGFLGLEAVIESNSFINNTGNVLALVDDKQWGVNIKSRDVRLHIRQNIFKLNRVVENVIFIDFSLFSEARFAVLTNNTLEDNEPATKDRFPKFYRRTTTRAVIVLKEGSFTLRGNIFENSGFVHQFSTLRHDSRRTVDAQFNWWGTADECEIIDRIFDFRHRVSLSPVDYFPFVVSSNKSLAKSNISRPFCFLRNGTIGGIVDRRLTLLSSGSPYEVRDDIIILTNGTLVVPKNVTLQFPPRSVMIVQGTLLVSGTENEKVRFVKKFHQGNFRLAGRSGPWEGRVEFLVNNTWLPLCLPYYVSFATAGELICQQYGLYYQRYETWSSSGEKTDFVHDVVCNGNVDSDIMKCNNDNWRYGPTCNGYTVLLYCRQNNWAGLHLAMSNYQNSLRHLVISDAGFAYRADLKIPGSALGIDLNHHNISNILINGSEGIGVHVIYQSLFHSQSLMPNSTISNTKSHGIDCRSPFLKIRKVNMTKNGGNGFFYASRWDQTNTFAAYMSSPEVSRTFHVCSENKTFVQANMVYYFKLETLDNSLQLTCEHILETEPGFKLVIQTLRYQSSSHYNYLHVHDNLNKTIGSPWKMEHKWREALFSSTNSSILIDFVRRTNMKVNIIFLVYTVKESKQVDSINRGIIVTESKITNSLQGGLFVRDNGLRSLVISDNEITNSAQFGIRIVASWTNLLTKFIIKNCVINESRKQGIYISNSRTSFIEIVNTTVAKSGDRGLFCDRFYRGNLSIRGSTFTWSINQGIYLYLSSSVKFVFENSVINQSQTNALFIYYPYYGDNVIRIVNSRVIQSGGRGMAFYGSLRSLFVSGNTFAWNQNGAIRYTSHGQSTILFQSNDFFENDGPTVEMVYAGAGTTWKFMNNNFTTNRGFSVMVFGTSSNVYQRPTVIITGNRFRANTCTDKGVIDIRWSVAEFELKENYFVSNIGRCVLLEGITGYSSISISHNLFKMNDCKGKSLIEAQRLNEDTKFTNNTLTQNVAKSVILVQAVHKKDLSFQRTEFIFKNNNLSENSAHDPTRLSTDDSSCAVILSGILHHKDVDFRFNKLNNPNYQKELCVRVPATSQRDIVNVTHNWWGTKNGSEVRDRISDFDDNYDFAIAKDWPFLLNGDSQTSTSRNKHDFKQHGHVLSGRLMESVTLKASQSPYHVTADFTVLENVTLTIEAGVTITVNPRVSILVAGELQVRGTLSKPVIFTARAPVRNSRDWKLQVRIVGGNYPWEGRVEVFFETSWKPISVANIVSTSKLNEVVCKQLGYGQPVSRSDMPQLLDKNVDGSWKIEVLCHGNETFLHECSFKEHFSNQSSLLAAIKCQGAPWGNIRFVSSRDGNVSQNTSTMEHVEVSYCGNRHGVSVPAIEAVISVPVMRFITIKNCVAGGVRVHFPQTYVHLNNSRFLRTGGAHDGINVLQTHQNIVVENSEFSKFRKGISFEESSADNIPAVHYGRIFLCGEEKAVYIGKQRLLYFRIQLVTDIFAHGWCQKVLHVSKGLGIKMTLLYFKGVQRIKVYQAFNRRILIMDKSNGYLESLLHKEIIITRDSPLMQWYGYANSEIMVQMEAINITDAPCTFERGFCGWQTLPNMSINGLKVTTTWKIGRYSSRPWNRYGYPYLASNEKFIYVFNGYQFHVRAAIISPTIKRHHHLCSLVFLYRLQTNGNARLSVYIQTGTFPRVMQRIIWSTKNFDGSRWRRVIITLPSDIKEYQLLLEGKCNKTSSYYNRNHVILNSLELQHCSTREHRISNSVFVDSIHQAVKYTSVADGSHRRPPFTIERCKITDTDASPSNVHKHSAISIEVQDNSFALTNSFLARNSLGAIEANLGKGEGTNVLKSLIYANTFFSNANGTIVVAQRKGLRNTHCWAQIVSNMFRNNLGYESTVKLSNIKGEILNNYFYNNSGLHSIEYEFSSAWSKWQRCELNTFYLNQGSGRNYGVTVLSNGPMEYHKNNFKNPSNLYEISSTRHAVSDYINAQRNWWGVGTEPGVGWRINDKNDDYRLASVDYVPFQKLPPRNILSLGCPADWLSVGTTCLAYRGGSRTFKEANEYCKYYGGNLASTEIPADMELMITQLQATRPDGKPPVPTWVSTRENTEQVVVNKHKSQQCTVLREKKFQEVVPCNSLYPFLCVRKAVIRCKNGCFHNGDCIGATCFCYRGWTGLDCSQFHCRDIHNCSGNGQCVGPNVCKCKPGFLGRGCTYSNCTKFHRCSSCSQGDIWCGWCDSLQQCLPGDRRGPSSVTCPDWFYYTCYTVGDVNHCSEQIQRVDSINRQCNLTQGHRNKESCQKFHDLEKCYNHVEKGKCRAWNETRCPEGLVKVDYKDSNRIENTVIRSNVKVINPNTTTIYSCPVVLPGGDDAMSVFVVPRGLEIEAGDVLSSPQAGGVMHNVNETSNSGPYTMILGSPARIEEVIQYADFTQRVFPVEMVDEATVDEEPNLDDLNGLLGGNITLNGSELHVLQSGSPVFKCVGHIYKVGDESVFSQFLVINKEHAVGVRPGDVIVSSQSHGFLEKVTKVSSTSDMVFLETELERCTENSTWSDRFKALRLNASFPDDDVVCSGGDNSLGLIITEPGSKQQNNISVNDSIIGRKSNPVTAKVIKSQVDGEYALIEVLPVKAIINGTAVTEVRFDQLSKGHRRKKRNISKKNLTFKKTYNTPYVKIPLGGKGYTTVRMSFTVLGKIIASFGVFTDMDNYGRLITKDRLFGLELIGEVIFNTDLEIGIKNSLNQFKSTFPVVSPAVQIGPGFCIPISGVCVPCAVFLDAEIVETITAPEKAFVPITFTSSAQIRLGGSCTFTGGCQKINPLLDVNRRFSVGGIKVQGKFSFESQLVPKLTFKLPAMPRWLRRIKNRSSRLWKKAFKFVGYRPNHTGKDWSVLRLSVEVPYGLKTAVEACSSNCMKDPNKSYELNLSYGFSEIVGKLAVGFGKKSFEIVALTWPLSSGGIVNSVCFQPKCENSAYACGCRTPPPPTTMITTTTQSTTPPPKTRMTTTTQATTPPPTTRMTTTTQTTTPPPTTKKTTTTQATTPPPTTRMTTTTQTTTPPPTTPPHCECPNGTGRNCKCKPKCKTGRKPIFVNKRFKCPEYPPCGEHPNCVVGRKGPGCSQLDVPGCPSGCSGNGEANGNGLPDCGSRCVCFPTWTGTCCERRVPLWTWGDPHLGTLDGIEFDYFGIGEFWGCKSLFNDFGIQFRYFAYQRASLTGGVAVKLGQSVLTIMSLNTTNPQEFPRLRIDGAMVNVAAHIGKKMILNNGSVVMDVQGASSNESDEIAVLLVSLQFDSGLTVTTDVRHSQVMGRQYLNVLFTPTAAFKGHTEGLCGVMDDDPSNDLRGPNGEQYKDPIQFGDSWRITAVQRNSSFRGTWSWNSSNFHRDDVMDSSYNDPYYTPLYSLDDIDGFIIAKATSVCSSLGLSKTMLKSCIYDVAVTNDTSMAKQDILKQDCPNQCSGKGRCVNATCHCMIGWSGDSCQLGECANCSSKNGKCEKGFCKCNDGWEGATCEHRATCYNVNNCTSLRNGVCRRTDQCRCHDGYVGLDCSIVPTCANVSDCSKRGICIDYDVCKCKKGWSGKDCTQFSCETLDYCSGRGRCVAPYKCHCDPGWTGVSCALPDCAGVNQCSGHGECVSSNFCQCYPGFQGVDCSDVADCSSLRNCSGNGACMQDKQGGNLTCRCFSGFSGPNCSIPSCVSVNNCSGHGLCIEASLCKCDQGYTGDDCANASCEALNYCSGHGVCVGFDTCICHPLWRGPACSVANCSNLNDCSNKGDCILPNTCECYPGYDDVACNTTAKPNLHAPVFVVPLYNLSLSENVPIKTAIIRVNASDGDPGRNGQLLFSIDDNNNANSAFTIDSLTGSILTTSGFDYESSSPHFYQLKVVASDNGTPRKSSYVVVYISIVDENDNCPVFNSLQQRRFNISLNTASGTLLTVLSANDKDSGNNGKVRYSLSNTGNYNGAFDLSDQTGELTTTKGLTEKEYRLIAVARDLGVPSCSREIMLTVNVFAGPQLTKVSGNTEAPSKVTIAEVTTKRKTNISRTTEEVPLSLPHANNFRFVIAVSVGSFIILVVILLIICLCRKWKRRARVKAMPPSSSSHHGHVTVNEITVYTTPDGQVKEVSNNEAYEMENVREFYL